MPLMEDEQLVLRWLSQYGPLSKNVLRRLLHYKNTETRDRILSGMRRRRYIYEINLTDDEIAEIEAKAEALGLL